MTTGPNPAAVVASILRARRVATPMPEPDSSAVVDHVLLAPILEDLRVVGVQSLPDNKDRLDRYRREVRDVEANALNAAEALSLWINVYNAGALNLAATALTKGADSVLRVPGAFDEPWIEVDAEVLTLNDIEHGKIRRFGDPRIHAALVCGSVSCPTLRYEPFTGSSLDCQLNDQMQTFLASGGATVDRSTNEIHLSKIFSWYGRDFTRPDQMPSIAPDRPSRVRDTVAWWLAADDRDYVWQQKPAVKFMPYDWGLACSIAPPIRKVP